MPRLGIGNMHQRSAPSRARGALGAAALLALAACGGGEVDDTVAQAATGYNPAQASALTSANAAVGSLRLVSTTIRGAAAIIGSTTCAVSADGSLVLFDSSAPNLVAGDSNGVGDLFLRNLSAGTVTRVATQSGGAQLAAGSNCPGTSMTPDGRVVAFNLVSPRPPANVFQV